MNKNELVDVVHEKTGLTKKQINATLGAILDSIQEAVAQGDKVTLVGFGTFEAQERPEREGRNPSTGEKITVGARRVTRFKAGKPFSDRVATIG